MKAVRLVLKCTIGILLHPPSLAFGISGEQIKTKFIGGTLTTEFKRLQYLKILQRFQS